MSAIILYAPAALCIVSSGGGGGGGASLLFLHAIVSVPHAKSTIISFFIGLVLGFGLSIKTFVELIDCCIVQDYKAAIFPFSEIRGHSRLMFACICE